MKNLKIVQKLMVGFGGTIAIMILICVLVSMSNNMVIEKVNAIDNYSTIQTMCKNLIFNFYEARINARIIYLESNNEAYNKAKENNTKLDEIITQMIGYIDEYKQLDVYTEQLKQTEQLKNEWYEVVDSVQQCNLDMDQIISDMLMQEQEMLKSKGLVDLQMQTIRDEMEKEITLSDRYRRVNMIENMNNVNIQLEKVVKYTTVMTGFLDVETYYQETIDILDTTIDTLEAYLLEARRQEVKDLTSTILDAAKKYKDLVIRYRETVINHDNFIDQAALKSEATISVADKLMISLDDSVANEVDDTVTRLKLSITIIIIIIGIAIASSAIIAVIITNGITRPVRKMKEVIDKVKDTGNLIFTKEMSKELEEASLSKDEIGTSIKAFSQMLERFVYISNQLEAVSKGDLSISINTISEIDTIGNSLKTMIINLNEMFSQINQSTYQVAAGSNQIAHAAQVLAQGSTEQAESIKELSNNIEVISSNTDNNSSMANDAERLAQDIKQIAQKGSVQMDEMVTAVTQINEASQVINKVIKVIDDIAFQTNILALNAAVEAARAGTHGKGFAVVAEEVRNLAAKSADAARETGELIANSIEKAQIGVKIANETSASLHDIVEGVNKSSDIVINISKSSKEQLSSITEITKNISQVNIVVQQNSATAEQSAAASQELSGQSAMLEELVNKFKLSSKTKTDLKESKPSKKKKLISLTDNGFDKY